METKQAVCLRDLAKQAGISMEQARVIADELVQRGEVEVLKPVVSTAETNPERIYYRLLRSSDEDYLWQREVKVRLVPAPLRLSAMWQREDQKAPRRVFSPHITHHPKHRRQESLAFS